MKQHKRIKLYHTFMSEEHPSFVMSNDELYQKTKGNSCQVLSRHKTRQRYFKTFINFRPPNLAIPFHNGESKGNEFGLSFRRWDL